MRLKGSHPERSRRVNGVVCLLLMSVLCFSQVDYVEIAILEPNAKFLSIDKGFEYADTNTYFDLNLLFTWEDGDWHSSKDGQEKKSPEYLGNFNGTKLKLSLDSLSDNNIKVQHSNLYFTDMPLEKVNEFFVRWSRMEFDPILTSSVATGSSLKSGVKNIETSEFSFLKNTITGSVRDSVLNTSCIESLVDHLEVDFQSALAVDSNLIVGFFVIEFRADSVLPVRRSIYKLRSRCDKGYVPVKKWEGDESINVFACFNDNETTFLTFDTNLLSAGDYNHNGKLEWIFKLEGLENNGYILYYDNFTKKVEFYKEKR